MVAVDYDCHDKQVYWTDVTSGSIQRSNYDGSAMEVVISGLVDPQGLLLYVPLMLHLKSIKSSYQTCYKARNIGKVAEGDSFKFQAISMLLGNFTSHFVNFWCQPRFYQKFRPLAHPFVKDLA